VDALAGEGVDQARRVTQQESGAANDAGGGATHGKKVTPQVAETCLRETELAAEAGQMTAKGGGGVAPGPHTHVDVVALGKDPAVASGQATELQS
jgi:hypothetical protein